MAKDKCRPWGGGKSKVREKRTNSSDRRSQVALSATSGQWRGNSRFASQGKLNRNVKLFQFRNCITESVR
jgi:hypothetical protein